MTQNMVEPVGQLADMTLQSDDQGKVDSDGSDSDEGGDLTQAGGQDAAVSKKKKKKKKKPKRKVRTSSDLHSPGRVRQLHRFGGLYFWCGSLLNPG